MVFLTGARTRVGGPCRCSTLRWCLKKETSLIVVSMRSTQPYLSYIRARRNSLDLQLSSEIEALASARYSRMRRLTSLAADAICGSAPQPTHVLRPRGNAIGAGRDA